MRVNHEARGKEDRGVLSAQETSLLLTKENRAEPIPYRSTAGETPTPMAVENRAELILYRPTAGETPTLVAMRSQLAPPEQSIWSNHLLRGPRRGSPQGSGNQWHHKLQRDPMTRRHAWQGDHPHELRRHGPQQLIPTQVCFRYNSACDLHGGSPL
jgi:hypothetical protein